MAQTTEHKEARASVRIVYRTYDVQKDGSCPFFICITKERKRKYIATGITLHPKHWDEAKQAIRKNYPDEFKRDIQNKLKKLVEKYENAANALVDADEQHDVRAVANKAIEGRKQTRKSTVLAYIDSIVEDMVKTRKMGNSIVYHDLRNQLCKFITDEYNTNDISFNKVTVKFCHEWESTLRATGATDNTLSNRFRTLRAVLNRAIANGYARPDNYPFSRNVAEKHKFSIGKFDTSSQKRALSRDTIRSVENYEPKGTFTANDFKTIRNPNAAAKIKNAAMIERQLRAKDIFLFSFYVAGINFVDIAKLRWKNIQTDDTGNQRVIYTRQKTGGKFSLKLLAPAVAILDRYKSEKNNEANSYIFPILDNTKHTTAEKINNRLHKVLGQTNTDLKAIGTTIGISTPLTTYVARHSFATNLKHAGHANAVIGQAMGHKDESTTNIYLDSFGSDTIDSALSSLL
ncbi:site-specific integrase [Fibrivirga algicola]|uniref:Site-specific integrase n=1 Tax=Fibrivirga algicola TaxID=2950420 RepID=A0ABX0QD91_9BACT|nr:site-specific integrase [Fibrivirga algicola]NID08927.1 site-specific integrase [Fibrivirga algicola]